MVGNIDPKNLPVSDRLRHDLLKWAEWYDSTLNIKDPATSGFRHKAVEEEFKRVGHALGERLQKELGNGFTVVVKFNTKRN